MDDEIRRLWERYREAPDPETRQQLILQYAPLVKYVAGRVGVGMPANVEHADLVSYGMFGLMDAIEKFDLSKGYKFETYAITRIRGAIIDELRSMDWVPRSVRTKARQLEGAVRKLEMTLQRTPTDEELAAELDVTTDELATILTQVSLTSMVALDETLDASEGDTLTVKDTLQDANIAGPDESFDEVEMRDLLKQAIGRLTEREQTVLALYYFEGLTLAQIGGILGVTESRVCQIHTKSVLSLRSKLKRTLPD